MKTYKITIKTKYMNLGFVEQGKTREDAVVKAVENALIQCGLDIDDVIDFVVVPWQEPPCFSARRRRTLLFRLRHVFCQDSRLHKLLDQILVIFTYCKNPTGVL